MLDLLLTATGVELGKLALDQVLNLGKSALEDYVKDFFKNCVKSGVALAHVETLKKPMAEAVGCFVKRFVKELQMNDVPASSIEHHYKNTLKQFVRDQAIRPVLGQAFEKNCKQIDYAQLEILWTQKYQADGWQFPSEEFDWRGVAKEYVYEVKGIIKANPELRSLLNTELLEDIARNTAQISPGFEIEKYRESLQCSYGYLKLYTLDTTDRGDTIKLWNIFVEPTVREALPPTRYELPLDLRRNLEAAGQLSENLSLEAFEHYRSEYLQKPPRKALEAITDSHRMVILGDPGSGKSSLLQYLALEWVEGKLETLPLLLELREFALSHSDNFLEFLHRGRGVDWQFDQHQLHQHLAENPTIVMFDGLDEVFDRAAQSAVMDDIIRFAQQYPKAKVLVTSRIVGYHPERLQQSGFRHFTLQPLATEEIHTFIDHWYDLSMGQEPDQAQLKQRLKDAIATSRAIANLADNPLLLTMMALLNRRQELPRDRTDLYDQASRVLLYHWDVDHKRLKLPVDAIGRREKQAMLRAIAYEMQAGESGLQGNLISAERLTQVLTDSLSQQGFSEPREKANLLIHQLRERNFILCYRGADTYGFVHRTFLEYFCAAEIVRRFEKERTLSVEQLKVEIFGKHWQDDTWNEVLRLICGMVSEKFAGELIEFLTQQKSPDAKEDSWTRNEVGHLQLAAECLAEVSNPGLIAPSSALLLQAIQQKVEDPLPRQGDLQAVKDFAQAVERAWRGDEALLSWLKSCLEERHLKQTHTRYFAVTAIAAGWGTRPDILPLLKHWVEQGNVWSATQSAASTLLKHWQTDPETLPFLQKLAQTSPKPFSRGAALRALAQNCSDDPQTLPLLKAAWSDENRVVRWVVLEALGTNWPNDPETLPLIKSAAQSDSDWQVRGVAIELLTKQQAQVADCFELLCQIAKDDPYKREEDFENNPRLLSIQALAKFFPAHPRTLELLHDRGINDTDPILQAWAKQQLEFSSVHQSAT